MAKKTGFDLDKTVKEVRGDKRLMMLVGGALAAIVGTFLPWATIDIDFGRLSGFLTQSIDTSINGFDANGTLLPILAIAAVVLGLNLFNKDRKNMVLAAAFAGAVATLVVLIDYPSDNSVGVVSVGIGYWLSLLGSIAMVAGSVWLYKDLDSGK